MNFVLFYHKYNYLLTAALECGPSTASVSCTHSAPATYVMNRKPSIYVLRDLSFKQADLFPFTSDLCFKNRRFLVGKYRRQSPP